MEEPEKRYVVKYGNNYDNCEEEFYSLDKVISFCALIKHRNKYPRFNGFDGHRDKTFSVNEILIIEERNLMYESEFCEAVEKENERLNFKSKQELQVNSHLIHYLILFLLLYLSQKASCMFDPFRLMPP